MAVARTAPFTSWSDHTLERTVLDDISLTVPWSVVERFSSLVRLSGSPEEREAFTILMRHLDEWGVPYTLHEPEAFISIPLAATVRVGDRSFRAKTAAMSVSTGGKEITGQLVYMPSDGGERAGDVFSSGVDLERVDVRLEDTNKKLDTMLQDVSKLPGVKPPR